MPNIQIIASKTNGDHHQYSKALLLITSDCGKAAIGKYQVLVRPGKQDIETLSLEGEGKEAIQVWMNGEKPSVIGFPSIHKNTGDAALLFWTY